MNNLNFLKIINQDISNVLLLDLNWKKFSDATIVITGATGFIGSYIVRTLLALNDADILDEPLKVVAMVRNISTAKERFSDLVNNQYLSYIEWDLCKFSTPNIGDASFVIHAASNASPRFYNVDPLGTALPNSIGTYAMMRALEKSKQAKGFVFISSSEVYGKLESDKQITEKQFGGIDPCNIRSCYAESKRFGETLLTSWGRESEIPYFIVRPFHTYGPGLNENDGRVFADFVFDVINDKPIVMKSGGFAVRAFCYISDAIAGLFTVLLKGSAGESYNLANPRGAMSILELANLLVSVANSKNVRIQRTIREESDNYSESNLDVLLPDVSKLKSLGWQPKINPTKGFERMIKAYVNE